MKTTFIFYSFFFISWPSPLSSLSSLFLPDLAQLISLYLSLSQCLSFLCLSLSLSACLALSFSLSFPLCLYFFSFCTTICIFYYHMFFRHISVVNAPFPPSLPPFLPPSVPSFLSPSLPLFLFTY